MSLRNCPYNALATDHRDLTCGMNLAWAQGVVDGWRGPATVKLDPAPRPLLRHVPYRPPEAHDRRPSPLPDQGANQTRKEVERCA